MLYLENDVTKSIPDGMVDRVMHTLFNNEVKFAEDGSMLRDGSVVVEYIYLIRAMRSNMVLVHDTDGDGGDELYITPFEPIPEHPDAPLSDYILLGAKDIVEHLFIGENASNDIKLEVVQKTNPDTYGTLSFNGKAYVLTYIFVDDTILEQAYVVRPDYHVKDFSELKLTDALNNTLAFNFYRADGVGGEVNG